MHPKNRIKGIKNKELNKRKQGHLKFLSFFFILTSRLDSSRNNLCLELPSPPLNPPLPPCIFMLNLFLCLTKKKHLLTIIWISYFLTYRIFILNWNYCDEELKSNIWLLWFSALSISRVSCWRARNKACSDVALIQSRSS